MLNQAVITHLYKTPDSIHKIVQSINLRVLSLMFSVETIEQENIQFDLTK